MPSSVEDHCPQSALCGLPAQGGDRMGTPGHGRDDEQHCGFPPDPRLDTDDPV